MARKAMTLKKLKPKAKPTPRRKTPTKVKKVPKVKKTPTRKMRPKNSKKKMRKSEKKGGSVLVKNGTAENVKCKKYADGIYKCDNDELESVSASANEITPSAEMVNKATLAKEKND